MSHNFTSPLAIATLLLSSLALGNDSTSSLEEVVTTASRIDQQVGDVPTNISFISDIEAIGATHINETMQKISGVWISRGNGQESLISIRSPVLTGAGGCGAFLTSQDGIPLRASGFCNVNELFDANSEQAGRIEVIKGPATVSYGSNTMHGMINVITPDINDPEYFSFEGGENDYFRAKLSKATENWRIDINGTSDGGYKEDAGFDQQKGTIKNTSTLAGFDATTVLSFTNLNQETAGFISGTDAYKDDDLKDTNPNPEAYRDSTTVRLYSTMVKELSSGTTLVLTPYIRHTEMEFIQHFLPGKAVEENGHDSIGLQASWHKENWRWGVDAELTQAYLEEFQAEPITFSAFLGATIPQGQHYDYDVDATTLAAFIEYTKALTDSVQISLGARYEYVEYDYDNNMLSGRTDDQGVPCGFGGCRFSRPESRTDDFKNFSPRLGITWNVSEQSQVYGFVSKGFRAPQATELYRLQGAQTVSNIDAEELDSIEVGFRGSNDRLAYDLSVYWMEKDNFIFRDSNRESVDNGETSHRGFEASVNYQIVETVSAEFSAAYAIHQYENDPLLASTPVSGNDIDTAPRIIGSARLNWQPTDKLNGQLEWIHMDEYYTDPQNLHEYEGHDLFNIRAEYQFSKQLSGFVRIMNAADTDYAERADFGFGSDRYFVGEPRTVYVGVRAAL
jgi:iron complex outermembrane receptor protein